MSAGKTVIAIDLGASSGRLIKVSVNDSGLDWEEIYRFPNEGISIGERCYTDILSIYHEIIRGLQIAVRNIPQIDAIGIDSWGVDFGFLDRHGELLKNPYHYRDPQADGMIKKAGELFGEGGLFKETGLQDMWYNTVYQLLGIKERAPYILGLSRTMLMISDIIGYFLTGEKSMEYTSVSTTQMYDMTRKCWSQTVCKQLGINPEMFPPIKRTGECKGYLSDAVCRQIGLETYVKIPLITTAQHDSAAAAYAVSEKNSEYLFINSGTWSIIGTVIDQPMITEEIFKKGYSNEGAAHGRIKLVKSIMGMWLVQELIRQWKKQGLDTDYPYLIRKAGEAASFAHYVDVEDAMFIRPENMENAMNEYCKKTGQPLMQSQGEFYRCAMESLALQYRRAVEDMEGILGKTFDTLYFLGGAAQNAMFCRMVADITQKNVCAGPVEATAIGNALIQIEALGNTDMSSEKADLLKPYVRIYRPDLEGAFPAVRGKDFR